MKTRKLFSLLLTIVLICTAAVASANGYGVPKYEEPITISFLSTDAKSSSTEYNADIPERESAYSNAWIRAYEEDLGIKIVREVAEDTTALNARLNTGMASADLPDVMIVDKDMFFVLAENGVLADLSEVWEKTDYNPLTRKAVDAWNGVLDNGMYEGQLLGFPIIPNSFNQSHVLWIRQDWLDKVGMEAPKTLDELSVVAKAFLDAKLGGDNNYAISCTTDPFGDILAPYGALYYKHKSRTTWQQKEDGSYVFGAAYAEKVKPALLKMQEMYKAGLLSKDIAVSDSKVVNEDVANGRIGLVYAATYYGVQQVQTNINNDPEAKWIAVPIPTLNGEPVKQWTNAVIKSFIVVNAECENPEAIFRMIESELHYYYEGTEEESKKMVLAEDGFPVWDFRLFRNFCYPTQDFMRMEEIKAGLAAGAEHVTSFSESYYQRMLKGMKDRSEEGYTLVVNYGYPVIDQLNKDGMLVNEYPGPVTENMTLYLGSINEALVSSMYKVVMGEDISVYEKAVEDWYKSGGEAITEEVNAYYAANAE